MIRQATLISLLAFTAVLSACGSSEPATAPAGEPTAVAETSSGAPTPVAEATMAESDAPADAAGMSGEDFIAQAAALSGQQVTLARCSLMTEPISDGQIACRVVDASDKDLKTPDGLPVDVFMAPAALDEGDKAWLAAECAGGFCTVKLTGTLDVDPATFFVSMTDVTFAKTD